jgi:lysophospholipase L1-like esterase
MKRVLSILGLIVIFSNACLAQSDVPYQDDIEVIRKYDNIYPRPKNPILFVGSSSIRLWIDFNKKFGKYGALNRGIGGAVINDITYWANDLIFKYEPRKIVLYVGENDLPQASTNADSVLNRTMKLYKLIRSRLPSVPIIYICPKPSPSRDQFQAKAKAANELVKKFLGTESNVTFLDIYTPMLHNGNSRPELFLEDMLHMNEKGYAIWEKKMRKLLK